MLISGKWGLFMNWEWSAWGEIRVGTTAGNLLVKRSTRPEVEGGEFCFVRLLKRAVEPKRVQVKDLSSEGMAINIESPAGQMCRWFGEIRKSFSAEGGIVNSHHNVSMYSCEKFICANFIKWNLTAECAPSAPSSRSNGTSISSSRFPGPAFRPGLLTSNHAFLA